MSDFTLRGPQVSLSFDSYDIYTDGACSVNPGPGGACFLVTHQGLSPFLSEIHMHYSPASTNNIMEMMAMLGGFQWILQNFTDDSKNFTLYSDSSYVINGLQSWCKGWESRDWKGSKGTVVKNVELWQLLYATYQDLCSKHNVTLQWVKGHNGNLFNELCDNYAVMSYKIKGNFHD